jgi:hypothetical protein
METFTAEFSSRIQGGLLATLGPDVIADLAGVWALRLEALVLIARNTSRPIEEQDDLSLKNRAELL